MKILNDTSNVSKTHPTQVERLATLSRELEASFLSEMLKSAGLGTARGAFGGGVGEEQFASFLRDKQAHAMTEAGGIGLAKTIFESLLRREQL